MSLPGGSGTERPLWSPAMSKTAVQNTAAVQNSGRPTVPECQKSSGEVICGRRVEEEMVARGWYSQ